MKMTVLAENTAPENLGKEWGLSIFAEYRGKKYLLDTGASELFYQNAKKLGIDIGEAEYGILSHAHFDHADGMDIFFRENRKASFYVRKEAAENCYSRESFFPKYIGIKKGTLNTYRDRIQRAEGVQRIADGVWLAGHTAKGLSERGKREHMCVRHGIRLYWDNFAHEQSAVFELPQGLFVFNGCCHGGVDNIIREVREAFPDKRIYAVAGGFHLYNRNEEQVEALCAELKKLDVAHIYTGHCTGKAACAILQRELGERVELLTGGKVIEL